MTATVRGLAPLAELHGRDLGRTDWVRITAEKTRAFTLATDGHDSGHPDENDDSGPYGGPIADGQHTLSLVGTLVDRLLSVDGVTTVIYGMNKVRLPSPVRLGARVRLHATITEVTTIDSTTTQAVLRCAVEIDGVDKPGCVADMVYRYYA